MAAVVEEGSLDFSADGGESWKEWAPKHGYKDVAMSSDGMSIFASCTYEGIIFTRDGGVTWQATMAGQKYAMGWCIDCSDDAQIIVAGIGATQPVISKDGGRTWTFCAKAPTDPGLGLGIAMNADGRRLAAYGSSGRLWLSDDAGVSWNEQTEVGSRVWRGIAWSSDGAMLVAQANGDDGIYIGR
jgi:photosystem II stability/assembly factor-like uncharacterized protein